MTIFHSGIFCQEFFLYICFCTCAAEFKQPLETSLLVLLVTFMTLGVRFTKGCLLNKKWIMGAKTVSIRRWHFLTKDRMDYQSVATHNCFGDRIWDKLIVLGEATHICFSNKFWQRSLLFVLYCYTQERFPLHSQLWVVENHLLTIILWFLLRHVT